MNIAHVVTSEMGSPEFNVKTVRMNIFWPFHAVVAGSGVSHSSLTCPSCHAKKGILFGDLLKNNILYPVPHRQYVFTIPIMLRVYFKFNRKLLTKLAHCAQRSLIEFFRISIGVPSGVPGLVTAIQTFGNYTEKFHPHLHIISTDGLLRKMGCLTSCPGAA